MDKVYAFVYSSCIYEEGAVTQSLHRTKKGAELAMEFHKEQERKEYEERNKLYKTDIGKDYPVVFGNMQYWGVVEMQVKE